MNSTLMIHNPKQRSKMMSFDEISALPVPGAMGSRHKPVHPAEIITAVCSTLVESGCEVLNERFAMNSKMENMFGVIDLAPRDSSTGRTHAVGVITSTTEKKALTMVAGTRVFICDNMSAFGDTIKLKRKHTTHMNLMDEISEMVGRILQVCVEQENLIISQEKRPLELQEALYLTGRALTEGVLPAASVRAAAASWLEPEYEDLKERTMWGLHNAFTREAKEVPPAGQLNASIRIGQFFQDAMKA